MGSNILLLLYVLNHAHRPNGAKVKRLTYRLGRVSHACLKESNQSKQANYACFLRNLGTSRFLMVVENQYHFPSLLFLASKQRNISCRRHGNHLYGTNDILNAIFIGPN